MSGSGFSKKTFEFLTNLEINNNRDWWLQHKQEFESNARLPLLQLIEKISAAMESRGVGLSGGVKLPSELIKTPDSAMTNLHVRLSFLGC